MKQPIWDLPVRLFHWTLGALIAFSWWTVETDHLEWHLYSGFAICTLIVFRLLWGFFGSSTARFANFVRGPEGVRRYLKHPASWKLAGHTPLGALSVLALLGAVSIQVGLGMFAQDDDGEVLGPLASHISSDRSDQIREVHGAWFWVLVGLIALHVAAIIFYKVRENKPLTKAMITGEGTAPAGAPPLTRGKWWAALLCLAIALAFTRWLVAGAPFPR